jgi:hypothetical protein
VETQKSNKKKLRPPPLHLKGARWKFLVHNKLLQENSIQKIVGMG